MHDDSLTVEQQSRVLGHVHHQKYSAVLAGCEDAEVCLMRMMNNEVRHCNLLVCLFVYAAAAHRQTARGRRPPVRQQW